MSVIYNLGIGLVAVDRASPAINSVDESLVTLRASSKMAADEALPSLRTAFRSATGAAHDMHMVLTGRSLDDDITEVTRLWGNFTGLVKGTVGLLGDAAEKIESLSFLGDLAGPVLDFEDATQKMAMGLGRTSEAAAKARQDIIGLAGATQFAVGEFIQLDQGLSQVGKTVGDFSAETGARMVELNQLFGVAGEDIGRVAVLTGQFGSSLNQTLDDATEFQRSFGIPGIFKELPGIVDFARESLIKYGAEATGGARSIMRNTQQMAGVYAKAFGKTIAQAVSSAQETLGRFLGATRNFRRVFLGLESDFDPLTQAFQQLGVPLFQVQGLLQQAQTDVVQFAARTRGIIGNLDPWRRSRFIEQLRDELPADLLALITDTEAYNAAVLNQSEATRRQAMLSAEGAAKFKDLSAGMLDTTKEMKTMWLNMKQLIKVTLVETGLVDVLREVFKRGRDQLVEFNKSVQAFVQSDRFKGWVKTVQPFLVTFGEKILLVGTALTSLAGGMRLISMATGRSIPLLGKFGNLLKGVAARAIGAVRKFFPLFNLISSVHTALLDMGGVLGDPNATGMEKFAALIRGTLKGVGKAFDNLLFGIPSLVLNKFFPSLEDNFNAGFARIFKNFAHMDVGEGLSVLWKNVLGWLEPRLAGLGKWLRGALPRWKPLLLEWGRTIGGALGGLSKMLGEGLVWAIKNLNTAALVMNAVEVFRAVFSDSEAGIRAAGKKSIGDSLLDIFYSTGELINEGVLGLIDGFLGAFGSSFEEAVITAKLAWLSLRNGTAETFEDMSDIARDKLASIQLFMSNVLLGIGTSLIDLQGLAKKAWVQIGNTTKRAINTLIIDPVNKLVTSVQQAFGDMLSGMVDPIKQALDSLPASVRDSLPGLSDLSTTLGAASEAASALRDSSTNAIEPFKTLTQAGLSAEMRRINEETIKSQSSLVGISDALAETLAQRKKDRDEARMQAQEARRAEETQLGQALSSLRSVREQAQARSTDARRFQEASRAGYDNLFAQLRREAGSKLGERRLDAAQRSLSAILDESLRSVTTKVREGQISASDAQIEFDKAASDAIKRVIRENQAEASARTRNNVSASTAAARATGPRFVGASISPEMWKGFIDSATRAGSRPQQVEVSFRGAGQGIDRVLNNTARVTHHGKQP